MKYSLWTFRDWLEGNGISLSYHISDNDAYIEQIRMEDSPQEFSEKTAFVVDCNSLPDCNGFRCALLSRNNRLLFPVTSSEQILNLSMSMMEYYNNRESVLYELLASGCGMCDLLEGAASLTGFPLAYLPGTQSLACYSDEWDLQLTDNLLKELDRLSRQPEDKHPFFYISDASSFTGTIVAKPLQANMKNGSYVLLYDAAETLRPGDIHIFSAMVDLIREAVLFHSDHTAENIHPLTDWFRSALFDEQIPNINPAMLSQVSWTGDDYYQIACIAGNDDKDIDLSNLCRMLSDNGFCFLTVQEGLSVLIHLNENYPAVYGKAASSLETFCVRNNLRIGYSLPFRSLSLIREFYQQSVYMLSLRKAASEQSVKLSEILADRILEECASLPDTQAYIHPDIRLLAELDDHEKEPLMETLYTYLVLGRSASHAASQLFIHRNTLQARLKKIQRHLSFSIEDYNNIDHILISLIIIRKTGKSN